MTPAERIDYYNEKVAKGFEVLEPKANELLLDLDWMGHPVSRYTHMRHLKELRKRLARLDQYSMVVKAEIKQSMFHYHGRVRMSYALEFKERQLFEMLLGSDPCRAQHNLNHEGGPYAELLCTLPGPWTAIKWSKGDL